MDSKSIGYALGTMINSHDVFTGADKGHSAADIVVYIQDLESQIAELKGSKERCELHCMWQAQQLTALRKKAQAAFSAWTDGTDADEWDEMMALNALLQEQAEDE